MKPFLILPVLLIGLLPFAFAENSLENKSLFAESATVTLDLQFGKDDVKYGTYRDVITNTLNEGTVSFYGDEITISDSQVKVSGNGEHFRIYSIDEKIMMYGHYSKALENYKINMYLVGQDGFTKFTVTTSERQMQSEKIKPTNSETPSEIIDLHILIDQYERVYNKSDYKFFVKTFDKSIYSDNDFNSFQGKISGAKVSSIIVDPDGVIKSDMNGIVENGIYEGLVYVPENLWQRGWYTVDIIIESQGKSYQKQISFYVFGHTVPSDNN